jgi:hypothetical protein
MLAAVRHERGSCLAVGIVTAVLCASSVADAHHSFARFDMEKLVTFHGTVKEWRWANPHSWLYLAVSKPDGSVEKWGFECSSPNMMIRWGWNMSDVKVGDKITVDAHPARDGQHIGAPQILFLASGKVVADPMGQKQLVSGDQLAEGPGPLPKAPQGVEYR